MQDRIPTPGQEGRVLITPENGDSFYARIALADNPVQVGTSLNKGNLLSDTVAAAIQSLSGFLPNVPSEALGLLNTVLGNTVSLTNTKARVVHGQYTGTGTWGSTAPNTLTAPFDIYFMFVVPHGGIINPGLAWDAGIEWMMGIVGTGSFKTVGNTDSGSTRVETFIWNGHSVSWYFGYNADGGGSDYAQFNGSGTVYDYVLLGM